MSNKTLSTFWNFAVALYGRDGAKAASLALQDEHGDDVVLVYGCLYAAIEGGGTVDLAPVIAALAPWQAGVTDRLRAARRVAGPGALATQILAAELAAERIAYDRAEPLLGPVGASRTGAEARAWALSNFARYRVETARSLTPRDEALFAHLLTAALDLRGL